MSTRVVLNVEVLPFMQTSLVQRGLGRLVVTVTTEPAGLLSDEDEQANAASLSELVTAIRDAVGDGALVSVYYEPDSKAIADAVACYGASVVAGLAEVTVRPEGREL